MGTPDFAVNPLKRLCSDGHEITCVVTQPDKPRDRGMRTGFNPVKQLAAERGIMIYQPVSLRDDGVIERLRGSGCDLIVVVAYGKRLPEELLDMPPFGCINIHGSLLPKYRGAAPVQWAVLSGETETGVTAIYMGKEIDSGDILASARTAIGDDETAGELYNRLSFLGADLLSQCIDDITRNTAARMPQNHAEATFAPPLKKDMSPIDWSKTALSIKYKVRGLNPWPVATAELNGAVCKVFSVDIGTRAGEGAPGTVLSSGNHGIEVACSDGSVIIRELQAPGGKRMPAAEYIKGHAI